MSSLRKEDLLLPQWKLVRLGLINSLATETIPSLPTGPVTREQRQPPITTAAAPGLIKKSILSVIRNHSVVQSLALYLSRTELLSLAIGSRNIYEQIKSTTFQYSIRFDDYFKIFSSQSLQKPHTQRSSAAGILTSYASRPMNDIDAAKLANIAESRKAPQVEASRRKKDVAAQSSGTGNAEEPAWRCFQVESCTLTMGSTISEDSAKDVISTALSKRFFGESLLNLSIEGSSLGPKGIIHLCDLLRVDILPNILSLNISRNLAGETATRKLKHVVMEQHCSKLKSLDISGNKAAAAVLEFFHSSFSERVPYIDTFVACSSDLDLTSDTTAMGMLMQGNLTCSHFKQVDLSYNPLGDHGLALFLRQIFHPDAMWKPLLDKGKLVFLPATTLKMDLLRLQEVSLGIQAMQQLTEAMYAQKMTSLKTLCIAGNDFGHPGMQAILAAIGNGGLENLSALLCSLSNISDMGLNHIGAALSAGYLDQLEVLDISDVGANSFSINQLARVFEIRYNRPGIHMNLKELKLFGHRDHDRDRDRPPSLKDALSKELTNRVQIS